MSMILLALAVVVAGSEPGVDSSAYCTIRVVDEQTGRGVPLVELRTVNSIRYFTDSNGIVAFYEPGMMDQDVFFWVTSHGYEYPKDGFGYAGKRVHVETGGTVELKVRRKNIAERLYRITGEGIYRDSVLVGQAVPIREPVINGLVLGQDSVQNVLYKGKLYWFWGDTSRAAYPLGNFHMSGATSRLPSDAESPGLDPGVGVNLAYFVDENGFSKQMAPRPEPGPVWMDGFVTLPDESGTTRMYGHYARVTPQMQAVERGFMVFNDETEQFEKIRDFPLESPAYPSGYPFTYAVDGVEYFWFPNPFPLMRVRAELESYLDVKRVEVWTPLKEGSTLDDPQIDRDGKGKIRYGWKRNTPALDQNTQAKLIEAGKLREGEAWIQLRDVETGDTVLAHSGSVFWNEYRQKWITIRCQLMGTSMLGETWFAEADTPIGPWVYGRKIVTHDQYTFYNPKQHPYFDQENGKVIYFEGTYANTFSGNPDRTPRYDYNQIMYRLDVSDDRLTLPVPVYRVVDDNGFAGFATRKNLRDGGASLTIAFFALDRPHPEAVAVRGVPDGTNGLKLEVTPKGQKGDLRSVVDFYALPGDVEKVPATVTALYEYVGEKGEGRIYSVDPGFEKEGYSKAEKPVCYVWKTPYDAGLEWPVYSFGGVSGK